MAYTIQFTSGFEKDLKDLPKQVVEKIIPAVMALANNPRPSGCKKLKGSKYNYRIRIGDYRVIYEIEDAILRVSVLAASHRKDIYE